MTSPMWVVLTNPVPQVVTDRAVTLLHILSIGQWRVETCAVDCQTSLNGVMSQVLKYACEDHGGGKKGITVYGLV